MEPIPELYSARLIDTLVPVGQPSELAVASLAGPRAADSSGTDGGDNATYDASSVEKNAIPLPENRKPAYPRDLERRSIEASFSVFFVVDTTGRIDKETIEVPVAVNEQFASAVRRVLVEWQFFPALRHGRRVRQLMEQPIIFRMTRGDGRTYR